MHFSIKHLATQSVREVKREIANWNNSVNKYYLFTCVVFSIFCFLTGKNLKRKIRKNWKCNLSLWSPVIDGYFGRFCCLGRAITSRLVAVIFLPLRKARWPRHWHIRGITTTYCWRLESRSPSFSLCLFLSLSKCLLIFVQLRFYNVCSRSNACRYQRGFSGFS